MRTRKNQPFLSRLRFALAGVRHAVRTERSLQIQLLALLWVVIALARLQPSPLWWGLLLSAATTVLTAELLNTAVERLADHLHPDLHPEIRLVKDCAAGAVLIASAGALGVATALFIALLRGSL